MTLWLQNGVALVPMLREEAELLLELARRYDAIAFLTRGQGGWIAMLLPRAVRPPRTS